MTSQEKLKRRVFSSMIKAYHLVLSGCDGCTGPLHEALRALGIQVVSTPRQADLLIVSGVLTGGLAPVLKDIFATMPRPYFVVRVGKCMGDLNSEFENPAVNYAIHETLEKYLPIQETIEGCPPLAVDIERKLARFIEDLEISPELEDALEDALDKGVFKAEE